MQIFTFPDGRLLNLDAIALIIPHASSTAENRSLVIRFAGSSGDEVELKGEEMAMFLDALSTRGVDTEPTRRHVSLPKRHILNADVLVDHSAVKVVR